MITTRNEACLGCNVATDGQALCEECWEKIRYGEETDETDETGAPAPVAEGRAGRNE